MKTSKNNLLAAAAIMATSAVAGFLTQTTVFTERLLYNFGFVILFSIIIDIAAQLTIWKTISFSGSPVQELADRLLKGLGAVIIIAIAFGGLVFNIGNLAGTGLGMNAMLGIPPFTGTLISAFIVGFLFYSDNFLPKLDFFIRILALIMISLLVIMIFKADFDAFKVLKFTFIPEVIDIKSTITLVGGTVGGYISFAGIQRILDGGIVGKENQRKVEKSAYTGILFTGIFRFLLFLGVLSVVIAGVSLDPENPTNTVFTNYFGKGGGVLFGIMIWSASITSVIGATYTSLSFLRDLHSSFGKNKKIWALAFIGVSLIANFVFGKPVKLLVFAGYLNAFILPLGLIVILISIEKSPKLRGLNIPKILKAAAWLITVVLLYFGIVSLF